MIIKNNIDYDEQLIGRLIIKSAIRSHLVRNVVT